MRVSKSSSIIAAAVQLQPADSIAENLANAAKWIACAVSDGAQLVVLPENFAHLGRKDFSQIGLAESGKSGVVRHFLADQAAQHAIWLVGGTVPVTDAASGTNPFARSLLFDPSGEEVNHYDKIHLFDLDVDPSGLGQEQQTAYRESDNFAAGTEWVIAEAAIGRIGMTVCYDLRFAELFRRLADGGAEIITVPAAFTAATGRDHWQLLLRARAVENQVFVIGANMVDRSHPRRALWGGSAIIDPWGNVLAEIAESAGVAVAEIDFTRIAQVRQKMPVSAHRKL
jgi:deaminated glutathione amidase